MREGGGEGNVAYSQACGQTEKEEGMRKVTRRTDRLSHGVMEEEKERKRIIGRAERSGDQLGQGQAALNCRGFARPAACVKREETALWLGD